MLLYLDMCCFNRPFDDQTQIRICLETQAKLAIQRTIREHLNDIAWSYVLEAENRRNPDVSKRDDIQKWRELSSVYTDVTPDIITMAKKLLDIGIKRYDALHVSCAIAMGCEYFITVDKGILRKAEHVPIIHIMNPLEFTEYIV